ncbi:fibronectin type III domain-containing protein [Streptomyces phaeochromogenes]|uniref:fibronectin type III domain-containing protein n=1 Tax=Streptomyces phaeochromogenes TaxID=1923 RepID=UPI00225A54CD|nr:fibronectin type III domain-containing protein [Streptomyces phaeochromogenes]MCX5599220.1 fibronectin type III domain-containing protein [Streptomyces phaeochromogenes]
MRRVLLRAAMVCGALLMVVSCGWGGEGPGTDRPPAAPAGITAAAGSSTSVHVMWNRASGKPEVAHYEVYRGTTMVKKVPGSDYMVDITRLKPSTRYAFSVRARDADGRLGPLSQRVSATTPAATAADGRAPSTPERPRGKAAGSRAAQLSWDRSTDNRGVASYDIYQGDSKIHSVGGAQSATVVTGLRPGTRYSFTVRARDAADNVSPASAAVRITTPAGSGDGKDTGLAPTGFRASTHRTDGAYYLDLSWIPPDAETIDGVITEYQIQLDRQPATSLVWGGTAPRDKATYSFYVGREAGVTQRVRIRAKLPDGTWGGFSAERTVTTGAARP